MSSHSHPLALLGAGALTLLLPFFVWASDTPGNAKNLVQRAYPVADLVVPVGNFGQPPTEGKKTLEKQLLRLITQMVEPESWAERGGRGQVDYFPLGMSLVVRQKPAVHREIAALLDSLRKSQDVEVAVETRILEVPEDMLDRLELLFAIDTDKAKPVIFDHLKVCQLLEVVQGDPRTNVLQAPRITLFNAQESTISCLQDQVFVTGVEARWVGERVVFLPKTEMIRTGLHATLQPVVSADRRTIRLALAAELKALESNEPSLSSVITEVKPTPSSQEEGSCPEPIHFTQFIQCPRLHTVSMNRELKIPDGQTALVVGRGRLRKVCETSGPACLKELPLLGDLLKMQRKVETHRIVFLITSRVMVAGEEVSPPPVPVTEKEVLERARILRGQGTLIEEKKDLSVSPSTPKTSDGTWFWFWGCQQPETWVYDRIQGGIE
jgi:Bacterial type II and III secretion system protein